METIVVNLFGVPGAGKSTGAAHIFAELENAWNKCRTHNRICER